MAAGMRRNCLPSSGYEMLQNIITCIFAQGKVDFGQRKKNEVLFMFEFGCPKHEASDDWMYRDIGSIF